MARQKIDKVVFGDLLSKCYFDNFITDCYNVVKNKGVRLCRDSRSSPRPKWNR